MQYYIDTNILYFLIAEHDRLTQDVVAILEDYGNRIYISSESVKELIYLLQSGKMRVKQWKSADDVVDFINNETNIEIKFVKEEHLRTLAKLPFYEDHKDPSDRIIVAHAISDKIPIISSDRKFHYYVKHGLKLVFNKR